MPRSANVKLPPVLRLGEDTRQHAQHTGAQSAPCGRQPPPLLLLQCRRRAALAIAIARRLPGCAAVQLHLLAIARPRAGD